MEKKKKITIAIVTILVVALDLYILLHHNYLINSSILKYQKGYLNFLL